MKPFSLRTLSIVRGAVSALITLATIDVVAAAPKPLQIYFIDVEGGQSTLFVTPSGQSLLIDTGWPGNAYRDTNRIVAAAKHAKIKKLDYVWITHYHDDHVGGVPQLITKLPVSTFVDHGPNREDSKGTKRLYLDYEAAVGSSKRLTLKPGDKLPMKDLDVTVVSADGVILDQPLAGAGQPNSACQGVKQLDVDTTENARSLGSVITFGKLRIVDLGDLTWNKELELMCPNNKLGKADIFIASHHGMDISNSPALVDAIAPRVTIMDNGAKKGGVPAAWDILKSSPSLEDLWQVHFSDAGGKEHNVQDAQIANVTEADTGFYLKLTANADGSFEVYNSRNKFKKEYAAK